MILDLASRAFGCGTSVGCASMLSTFLHPSSPNYNLTASGDGSEIFVTEGYFGGALPAGLWNVNTDTFVSNPIDTSNAAAAAADGTFFAKDFGFLGPDMLEQSVAEDVDYLSAAINSISNVFVEKMHPSGSLLYIPQTNGVDIFDVHRGRLVTRVELPVQVPVTLDAMALDETGSRIFLISSTGLTVAQLGQLPLSIGTVAPDFGPASGGTTVIIRGSGFESGAKVSFGSSDATSTTLVDSNTIRAVAPPLSAGPTRIAVTNPDGGQYSLDAAFNAN